MTPEHFDVLILGAGLSGVSAGYHLQKLCPTKTFALLEARAAMGGTWDLFRYPGVRSDSDMYTLGYAFRPWKEAKAIADGPSILRYIRETAARYGLDKKVRYGQKAVAADWSSAEARWTVQVEAEGALRVYTCGFLFACTGYYDYAGGYSPDFPGADSFAGPIVHPQAWPDDLDYAGKRVVVIGSGATAVTLVPAMAKTAAHVTMLQRSPTYVVARPAEDAFANRLRRLLPGRLAYALIRWRNVLIGGYFYAQARKWPEAARARILGWVRQALGPDYDVETHFSPTYKPWDQRLCLVPDGDLFSALRSGKASVVTDHVARFTPEGIELHSGESLEADIIVTATGLKLQLLSGMTISLDGRPVDLSKCLAFKGMMYSGVPNLASAFGYTNASWTLKCDLTSAYVCRLINHMARKGVSAATPHHPNPDTDRAPMLDFTSGYVQRAISQFPAQGAAPPWRMKQSYLADVLDTRFDRFDGSALVFT